MDICNSRESRFYCVVRIPKCEGDTPIGLDLPYLARASIRVEFKLPCGGVYAT
jgi:hypothetical protein